MFFLFLFFIFFMVVSFSFEDDGYQNKTIMNVKLR